MRRLTPLALLLLIAAPTLAGDDLFSAVAIESVFGAATVSSKTASASAGADRLTNADALKPLVEAAGLTAERIDSKTVKTIVTQGGWELSTLLIADIDRDQVAIEMTLVKIPKESDWAASRLLSLLRADDIGGRGHFVFDPETRWLEVRRRLSNRGLTAAGIKRLLRDLAELAVSREKTWSPKAEKPATTAKTSTPSPSAQTQAGASLVGTWVATLGSGEAFAVGIDAQNRFQLAHVRAGKRTKSAGKIRRSGDQLTLSGKDGTSLTGTVSDQSATGFSLRLAGGRTLVFKKSA